MNTERRPVVGCEGRYEVSPDGVIYSLLTGRTMKPSLDTDGYPIISLCPGRGLPCRTTKVHHIVAAAFIGPRPDGLQVNHRDGVKTNNAGSNLEYVTGKENCIHRARVLGKNGGPSEKRAAAIRTLWTDPDYRRRVIEARQAKGYRRTPQETENRRRAARIRNMKRYYGDAWRNEYARRYPQFAHEVVS